MTLPTPADLEPWPEDAAPGDVTCAAFGLEGHGRLVWGEGNPDAALIVVVDNPGTREDASGHPMVCATRRALRAATEAHGLGREDIYLTFLVKCRPRRAYDRAAAARAGGVLLGRQVAMLRPRALLLLGDVVVRALLDPEGSVRTCRGRPHLAFDLPAAAGYHPLAVYRRPNLYPTLVADARLAAQLAFPDRSL